MKGKPYSDLQIRQAKAKERRQRLPCGEGLYVIVEPISKAANSKSFIGQIRFPYSRTGKQIEVRIGVYGKGINQYSLKEAREEWLRLKKLSKENNRDPRDIQKEEKTINPYAKSSVKSLGEVIDKWWEKKLHNGHHQQERITRTKLIIIYFIFLALILQLMPSIGRTMVDKNN